MQQTIKFDIHLPLHIGHKIKHIKEKSFYDHNYYELPEYGDWIDYCYPMNNILYVKYYECENCYSYYFGRFENDKFIKAFGYTTQDDVLDGIDIKYE